MVPPAVGDKLQYLDGDGGVKVRHPVLVDFLPPVSAFKAWSPPLQAEVVTVMQVNRAPGGDRLQPPEIEVEIKEEDGLTYPQKTTAESLR